MKVYSWMLVCHFNNIDYTLIHEDTIIFDTKNIIYKVPDNIKLYNYGNLYELNDS